MTQVSFYILKTAGEAAQLGFACRLAEKAHSENHSVYLHTPDTQLAQLDALLWTFRQGSFVPHAQSNGDGQDDAQTPVMIGSKQPPVRLDDVLINLCGEVPAFFSRFRRAVEIVIPEHKEAARERYKFYKDRGYALETHNIS